MTIYLSSDLISVPCQHEVSELRRRTTSAGHVRCFRQCLTCGGSMGTVPKSNVPDFEQLEEWDEFLWQRYEDERQRLLAQDQSRRESVEKARKAEWWQWYDNYLNSPGWKNKRRLVLDRAQGVCEGCRDAPATDVHHMTYNNVGNEFLWELKAICRTCHERLHGKPLGQGPMYHVL